MTSPNSSDRFSFANGVKAFIGGAMIAASIAAVDWRLALAVSGFYLVIDSVTPEPRKATKKESLP